MEHTSLSFPLPAKPYGIQPLDGMISDVISRDQRICQMCGADESDRCSYDRKKISLFLCLIRPAIEGGEIAPGNLRTICSTCADGLWLLAQNSSPPQPDQIHLLSQMRRATIDDQKVVLDWLLKKFRLKSVPLKAQADI